MAKSSNTKDQAGHLLSQTINFPDGCSFTRIQHITNLRHDEEEARILYICRKISGPSEEEEEPANDAEYVMKVKIQSVIASL